MEKVYREDAEKVLEDLHTNRNGLSNEEVKKRQLKYSPNKLVEAKKKTALQRFFEQLKDPMLIMLLAAAAISGITNWIAGESMAEVFIILIVVVLNAVLGVVQEGRAEAAIEALQTMTAAVCKVIRNGHQMTIPAEDLVPGDIVVLEAGDAVPADGRLIEAVSLKIEESALTGESVPVDKIIRIITGNDSKDIPLGDRANMCFMGTNVVYGRGLAVITDTGMHTEMGKIADALNQSEDQSTPLQKKLDELGKKLSLLVIFICIFIFVFDLIKERQFSLAGILNTLMIAVSLAVAAIPEGLATVVTVVLSIGVTRMSKENAVIRRLSAVETLGCTQVICSDKTGTLTKNQMTVVKNSGNTKELAKAMALCSDAYLNEEGKAEGEPTEASLVAFAKEEDLPKNVLEQNYPRIGEAPFDSFRKMMSTLHQDGDNVIQYTKGAPDVILKHCSSYLDDGVVKSMDEKTRKTILALNKSYADQALRVLCAAERKWNKLPEDTSPANLEQDLTYIGLTGMIDPVRPEVKPAIDECREAGITPVMITGDHKDTAVAIAKELGIIEDASEAVEGSDLDQMSDEELKKAVTKYHVYARVQPEHKVRIVNAWKARGAVTAMTGDGVNDAPSIKAADIGIGMGITGTDVTKNVADMILADDNFATIVNAVEEGRRIYDNIRKSIQFLLSSNMAEVLGVFLATLAGFTLLEPVHLLFINLITDCFPALALGMEKGEKDIMKRKPRDSRESIFAHGMLGDIIFQGFMIALLTLVSYVIGHSMEAGHFEIPSGISPDGMTMAFLTLNMAEIFHSFNMRSTSESIFTIKEQNKTLWAAMAGSLVVATAVVEIPFIANLFGFTSVEWNEYVTAIVLAFLIIPIVEIQKAFRRHFTSGK